jgi:ligand-binding SRPBCC domain-containing protein
MVKLQSTTKVAAPLEVVWVYFSKLQNMVEWDPTIKSVKELQRTSQIINSTYEITSKWEGEEEVSKF